MRPQPIRKRLPVYTVLGLLLVSILVWALGVEVRLSALSALSAQDAEIDRLGALTVKKQGEADLALVDAWKRLDERLKRLERWEVK